VRHPVTYSVENGYHHHSQPNSHESHDSGEPHPYSYEHDDTRNDVPAEHDNEIGVHGDHSSEQTMHHDDHSPFVPPEPEQDVSQDTSSNQDAQNHINSHSLGYTSSPESEELNYNALPDDNYRYPPQHSYNSEEQSSSYHHQYQVHEDSPHEQYYGDYPSSSNTKTQVVPLNSTSIKYFKQKAKQKYYDRSRLNKKFMIFPLQVKKLRVMRPPPPAQVETWRTNMQHADSKLIPVKAYFDSKDLFKHPFFDFKSFKSSYRTSMLQPTLRSAIPLSKSGNGKAIPLTQSRHPITNFKSPVLVYPTNALRKRQDKVLRS